MYVAVALLVVAGGAAFLAWYNGSRARKESKRADVAVAATESLRSVNTELRASLERAVANVAARNAREATNDTQTADAARTDPQRAADLLNSLHEDSPGPGPHAPGGVPAGPVSPIPELLGIRLR